MRRTQLETAGFEGGEMGPEAKEGMWVLQAEKNRKQVQLRGFQQEYSPPDTLVLA